MADEDPPRGWRPLGPLALLDPRASSLGCAGCGACCEDILLRWDPRESRTPFVREHWTVEWVEDNYRSVADGSYFVVTCDAYDPVHRRCTAHTDRPDVCRGYPWYDKPPRAGEIADRERTIRDQATGELLPYACSYTLDTSGWAERGARPLIPVEVRATPDV